VTTVNLPLQRLEATLKARPQTDTGERRADMVWYTGATITQFSFAHGVHDLTLSMDPSHVRMGRLNSGRAPLLLNHADYSVRNVVGVIESATLQGASVRFSNNESVAPIWRDVQDGILANVSVGARLHKLKETTKDGDTRRSFTAVDWEPHEVSIVPVGADPGASFKASQSTDFVVEVEVIKFGAPTAPIPEETEVSAMPETTTQGQPNTGPDIAQLRAEAQAEERKRVTTLQQRVKAAGLAVEFAERHITDGSSLDIVTDAIFAELSNRTSTGTRPGQSFAAVDVDERDKLRAGLSVALAHRVSTANKLDDDAREFAGMSLVEMAKECLLRSGAPVRRMSRTEIAECALNLARFGGQHSTSDFPYILADVANKSMLAAYQYANPTYLRWTRSTTAPDFKQIKRLRLGEAPALLEVVEGGQITFGTMTESREVYALSTYGRRVGITRQAIINDDLQAFQAILPAMGLQVARLRNQTVYAILTANANMGDSNALFDATNHGNYTTPGTAISITSLDVGRAAMMVQTGLDGATKLNIAPRFLIVAPGKLLLAQQYTTQGGINPAVQTNINPFAGVLEPIADAELSGNTWYLAADPAVGTIEYCTLEGASQPRIMSREGWEVEGVEFKVVDDFAAKAVDWRGLYKNAGA